MLCVYQAEAVSVNGKNVLFGNMTSRRVCREGRFSLGGWWNFQLQLR